MVYKIKILTARKHKEPWLEEGILEYTKRLKNSLVFEWVFAKDGSKLTELALKEPFYLALSPEGKEFTSEQFSKFLLNSLQTKGSRLTLVIGDVEGLSPEIIQKAESLISLSRLTMTHQLIRLVLVEQVYRALEISKNSSYHK